MRDDQCLTRLYIAPPPAFQKDTFRFFDENIENKKKKGCSLLVCRQYVFASISFNSLFGNEAPVLISSTKNERKPVEDPENNSKRTSKRFLERDRGGRDRAEVSSLGWHAQVHCRNVRGRRSREDERRNCEECAPVHLMSRTRFRRRIDRRNFPRFSFDGGSIHSTYQLFCGKRTSSTRT